MEFGAFLIALFVTMGVKISVIFTTLFLLWKMIKLRVVQKELLAESVANQESYKIFNLLFWSLILFFFSEVFCGIETYILMRSDYLGRITHSLSSSTGLAVFLLGLFMLLDKHLIRFAKPKCMFIPVCRECTLFSENNCKFSKMVIIFFLFVLLACLPPFFASTDYMGAEVEKFTLPFAGLNNWYDGTLLPLLQRLNPNYIPVRNAIYLDRAPQILDYRLTPLVALIFIFTGLILYLAKDQRRRTAGINLAILGIGLIGFTYYELVLNRATNDLFVGAVGHEIGELLYLLFFYQLLKIFYMRPPHVKI